MLILTLLLEASLSFTSASTSEGSAIRVEALDLLRLAAALAVVLFHYAFRGAAADDFTNISVPQWVAFVKYGYLGVNLFFVISGFVIAWSAEGRTATGFAIARASRIYPGFVVCMSATFLAMLLFGAPRFEATAEQWFANLFIAAPFLGQPFVDGAYWSIVYELIFYGWVALLLAAGVFQRWLVPITVTWLTISLVNGEILHSELLKRLFITSYSGFFAAGLMLYAISAGRRNAGTISVLAAAVALAVLQEVTTTEILRADYGGQWSELAVGILSVAAVAAVALAVRTKRVPLPSGLVLALGGLTYPLYLLHQNIGYIAFNHLEGRAPASVLVLAMTALMVVISWAIWRFVERPGTRFVKRALTQMAAQAERAALAVMRRRPIQFRAS